MYILIPISLIIISLLGMGIIIARKFPYLRKLTPEAHTFGSTIFHDFFPELVTVIGKIRFEEYFSIVLRELEKLLRKLRLFFSRVDKASSELISELRSANRRKPQPIEPAAEEPVIPMDSHVEIRPRKTEDNADILKDKEQGLIIKIAHNPKDPTLYAALGEVYVGMGNFYDAKDSFEAAIDLDKQNESLKERLSFAERKLHETKVGF